jgi:hypothetical protein
MLMAANDRPVLGILALLVLAPGLAAVMISALLLFGVAPHVVFSFGFFVKSRLMDLGLHVPNAVGVFSTLVLFWAIIVLVWLALRKLLLRSR